ncbi:hypothetical protein HNP40_000321 [Mycobacteroides chelonae]|nr:hypothetical protein [Mycobacteroides chelonae]
MYRLHTTDPIYVAFAVHPLLGAKRSLQAPGRATETRPPTISSLHDPTR